MSDGRSKRRVDLTGQKFGWLTVLRDVGYANRSRVWEARCDCGELIRAKTADFGPSRKRVSCGCKNTTIGEKTKIHGMSKHPAHGVWMSMLNRCYNKKVPQYADYGGRGITVSNSWRNSFASFWRDMGPTYQRGLQIERRNNDYGYFVGNCYWATRTQQAQNKRNNHLVKTPWGVLCLSEAARRVGVQAATIRLRIKNNWPDHLVCSPADSARRITQ